MEATYNTSTNSQDKKYFFFLLEWFPTSGHFCCPLNRVSYLANLLDQYAYWEWMVNCQSLGLSWRLSGQKRGKRDCYCQNSILAFFNVAVPNLFHYLFCVCLSESDWHSANIEQCLLMLLLIRQYVAGSSCC